MAPQFLALGQETARIALATSDGAGDVWMGAGSVVHASCGPLTGEQGFFRMLGWRAGNFRINHGLAAPAHTIESDTTELLLEGMRLRDETAAGIDP